MGGAYWLDWGDIALEKICMHMHGEDCAMPNNSRGKVSIQREHK